MIFTGQDILADAPFSRIDLVSCRNLLIYLRPEVQERFFPCSISRCARAACFFSAPRKQSDVPDASRPRKKQPIYRHLGHSRPGQVEFRDGGE